ncbi:MAG: family 20 glycosylhydrolase, partial [Candidatus Sumerlaeota bacterium]
DWGYNTLFWHFCDDQGCRLRFPSRPELGSFNAWSADETRDFVEEAHNLGIQVIPEVETLGHTTFITGLDKYKHLRDGVEGGIYAAIAPCHPATRELIEDIVRDTAKIFDAPCLHIGMDEAGFGDHPHTRAVLENKTKAEIFAEHICWLHKLLESLGKRTVLWGDHLRPDQQEDMSELDTEAIGSSIADTIPKDVLICDWYYRPTVKADRYDVFLERGFEVLGCPATSASGLIVHPSERNHQNIQRMIDLADERREESVVGCVNTVWCSGRYLNGTVLYTEAIAAELMQNENLPDNFGVEFVQKTFGAKDSETVAEALSILHRHGPMISPVAAAIPVCNEAWRAIDRDEAAHMREMEKAGETAGRLLVRAEAGIERRHEFYSHLVLAARCFEHLGRGYEVLEPLRQWLQEQKEKPDLRGVKGWLADTGELVKALSNSWDRQRFAEDPAKFGTGKARCDYILERLYHAKSFIESRIAE